VGSRLHNQSLQNAAVRPLFLMARTLLAVPFLPISAGNKEKRGTGGPVVSTHRLSLRKSVEDFFRNINAGVRVPTRTKGTPRCRYRPCELGDRTTRRCRRFGGLLGAEHATYLPRWDVGHQALSGEKDHQGDKNGNQVRRSDG